MYKIGDKVDALIKNKKSRAELKYSLYLGLFRDCVPATEKCAKIMKKRDLIGHRVIIQPIEIREEQKHFLQKKIYFYTSY